MHRVILSTLPATLLPALVSVAAIAAYTRLLGPDALGRTTFCVSLVMAGQTVLFTPAALATTRLHEAARQQGRAAPFLAAIYALFACTSLVVWACAAAAWASGRSADAALPALVCLLLPARALVAQNQSVNRATGRFSRFNLVECVHAAAGLAAGLLLIWCGMDGALAVLSGLALAALLAAVIDWRTLLDAARSGIDHAALKQVLAFAWPLALAYAVTVGLHYADRLLVGTLAGAAALGIYGTAFSLVDRPVAVICGCVTAGTFPLAVEATVRRGQEAGRIQAGRNGAVLIGLALPACLGLALAAPAIAAVLVGPAFRPGVAALMPVLAATAFLRGLCAHYIDHAFHLARASRTMLAVYAPWACLAVLLSAMLLTRFGMLAAAWGALACQAGAALTGWAASRRALGLWLPGQEMRRIALCAAAMAAVLLLARALPADAAGLAVRIAAGAAAYGGVAWWLDLGGLRAASNRALLPRPAG